jgi:hypothetical protein
VLKDRLPERPYVAALIVRAVAARDRGDHPLRRPSRRARQEDATKPSMPVWAAPSWRASWSRAVQPRAVQPRAVTPRPVTPPAVAPQAVVARVAVISVVLGVVAALLMGRPAAAAETPNGQPSPFQALAFAGKGGPGDAVYGPNEVVEIIAGFGYYPVCPTQRGKTDRGLPLVAYSDIYVVPAGDPSSGGGSLSGGMKHTASAFGLLSLGETIGITEPSGRLGPGTYTVIFDECQDGSYDPQYDAKWEAAFRVEFPPVLPPVDPGLRQLKVDAARAQGALLPARAYCESKKAVKVYKAATGSAVALFSVAYPILLFALAQPDECTAVKNMYEHFKAIAADPPDPDFRRPTMVPPLVIPDVGATSDPVTVAAARLDAELEALLHSVERYQGAHAAKDPGWTLAHLTQVSDLARNAAVSATAAAESEAAGLDSLARDNPDLDAVLARADATRHRILADGLTEQDRQLLLNAGADPGSIDGLRTRLAAAPALPPSVAELRRQQAGSAEYLRALSGTLRQVAADANSLAESNRRHVPVERRQPRADAGGPYSATGSALTLTAAGSRAYEGATLRRWDWDLDGDGSFEDAAGETVHVAADRVGPLVGVRVLDSRGAVSVAYAAVAGATTLTVGLGQSRTFRAALPGQAPTWYFDGQQVATGREFTFRPTLPQAGIHGVTVVGRDAAGQLARTWVVAVPAPDADGDGWWANVDCDDTRPGKTLDDCSSRYAAASFATDLGSVTGVAFDPQGRLTATNQGGEVSGSRQPVEQVPRRASGVSTGRCSAPRMSVDASSLRETARSWSSPWTPERSSAMSSTCLARPASRTTRPPVISSWAASRATGSIGSARRSPSLRACRGSPRATVSTVSPSDRTARCTPRSTRKASGSSAGRTLRTRAGPGRRSRPPQRTG